MSITARTSLVVVLLVLTLVATAGAFAGTGRWGPPVDQPKIYVQLDPWAAVADHLSGAAAPAGTAEIRLCSVVGMAGALADVGAGLLGKHPDVIIDSGPSGDPNPVASGGTVQCSVTAHAFHQGHTLLYCWTATDPVTCAPIGSFDDPTLQNPVWTAPANNTDDDVDVKIAVKVSYVDDQNGNNVVATEEVDHSATGCFTEVVNPSPDVVAITAGPTSDPNPVDSGGSVACFVDASDTHDHDLTFAWTAKDGGGNPAGAFDDPTLQNPTWTAPANNTDNPVDYTLEVTVSDGHGNSDVGSFIEEVNPTEDVVEITDGPSGTPNPVDSGGAVTCSVSATDTHSHALTYAWTAKDGDGNPAGSFDDPTLQNPTWTAPANNTDNPVDYTLEVTVSDGHGNSDVGSFIEEVNPSEDVVEITDGPSGTPNPVDSGGAVACSVTASDTHDHDLTFAWTAKDGDGNPAGSFDDPAKKLPIWTAPANATHAVVSYTLEVTVSDGFGNSDVGSFVEGVNPLPDAVTLEAGPYGDPNPVASGGLVQLHSAASTSLGNPITFLWSAWALNGQPVGSFNDKTLQNPIWTAPANLTGVVVSYRIRLTVTSSSGAKATASFFENVSPLPHTLAFTVGPRANPNPVAGMGQVQLNAVAIDSLGHPVTYLWTAKDGAGNPVGSFDDPTLRSPIWTAPDNPTATMRTYTITVAATCSKGRVVAGTIREGVTQTGVAQDLSAGPWGSPNPVNSGGAVGCHANAVCANGHPLTFVWTAVDLAGNPAGSFSDAAIADPTWTAPANTSGANVTYVLSVVATCVDGSLKATFKVAVRSAAPIVDAVSIIAGPSANPNPVESGGQAQINLVAVDSLGHNLTYSWASRDAAGNLAGSFGNPHGATPIWTAPVNTSGLTQVFHLRVVITCSGGIVRATTFVEKVLPAP